MASKLSNTLEGFENTKQLFKQSRIGKIFAVVRNLILAAYFVPLATGIALVFFKPGCAISKEPLTVSGCTIGNIDMNALMTWFVDMHIWGVLLLIIFILIIKAFFMIKFINVKILPGNQSSSPDA